MEVSYRGDKLISRYFPGAKEVARKFFDREEVARRGRANPEYVFKKQLKNPEMDKFLDGVLDLNLNTDRLKINLHMLTSKLSFSSKEYSREDVNYIKQELRRKSCLIKYAYQDGTFDLIAREFELAAQDIERKYNSSLKENSLEDSLV